VDGNQHYCAETGHNRVAGAGMVEDLDDVRARYRVAPGKPEPDSEPALKQPSPLDRGRANIMAKEQAVARGAKFVLVDGGEDAELLFGKHSGDLVSVIASEDTSYLRWMDGESFPDELMNVVRCWLQWHSDGEPRDATGTPVLDDN